MQAVNRPRVGCEHVELVDKDADGQVQQDEQFEQGTNKSSGPQQVSITHRSTPLCAGG